MAVACDINQSGNWQLVFTGDWTATTVATTPRKVIEPIPRQELSVTLTAPTIMAQVTTDEADLNRSHLASVVQLYNVGGAGLPDDQASGGAWRLYRNQLELIQWADLGVSYGLLVVPRWYVAQLSLKIWELVCP